MSATSPDWNGMCFLAGPQLARVVSTAIHSTLKGLQMFAHTRFGRPSSRSLGLGFEVLERRDVMAGNVVATVDGGDLVIKGDGLSNGVKIMRLDANAYEVVGTMHGGSQTRINGELSKRFIGVTDDISVNLALGNDDLQLHGHGPTAPLSTPDAISIAMDAGNDSVFLNYVKAGGNIDVNSGSGADNLTAVGITVGNNMFVRESGTPHYAGNYDVVNIYQGSRIGNQLNVKLNQGNDTFKTNGTTAKSLWIEGGAGNDTTIIESTTATSFIRIDPGTGSDSTTVQNSSVGDYLTVTESSGVRSANDRDGVGIVNTSAKNYVKVEGNQGRETVTVDRVTADRLYASLGAGDDWMNIKYTTLRAWSIDGGTGYDTLYRHGNNRTFGSNNFNSFSNMYL
jgi:hypothetical protein